MLKEVSLSSVNITTNNGLKKSLKNNNVSMPMCSNNSVMPITAYNVNNLKANYMPIAFKGLETKPDSAKALPEKGSMISIETFLNDMAESANYIRSKEILSNLAPDEMIRGSYYGKLSDNVATVLGAGENVVLNVEEGAKPDIFVHSLVKNVMKGKYNSLTGDGSKAEIIKITDPVAFTDEANLKSPESMAVIAQNIREATLETAANGATNIKLKKDVKIQAKKTFFELVKGSFTDKNSKKILVIDGFDALSHNFRDIGELIKAQLPGISVIGLSYAKSSQAEDSKPKLVVAGGKALMVMPQQAAGGEGEELDIPTLKLHGINTAEAKEFLKKNPEYLENTVLYKFDNRTCFTMSKGGVDELVDRVAEHSKIALPGAAKEPLPYIVSTIENSTKARLLKGHIFPITAAHVQNFYTSRPDIIKQFEGTKDFSVINDANMKMDDLAGLEAAKVEVKDAIDFLANPRGFAEKGRKIPSGLLFEGPPGTAKSEMVRCIVGEVKAKTGKNIPIFYMTNTGNMYKNSGQEAIRGAYENAREYCRKVGADSGIVVWEEIDKICRKIHDGAMGQEDAITTNELKIQMDSVTTKGSDVNLITIGTTNHMEVFDDALIRPGRFKTIHFDVPETNRDIVKLLQIHSKKKPFASEAEKKALFEEFAPTLKGLNGDEMTQVLDEATRYAINSNKKIERKELTDGLLKALFGPRVHCDDTVEDRLLASMHELGHALNESDNLVAICNESRDIPHMGRASAFVFDTQKPRIAASFDYILDKISMAYGGGEAEKIFSPVHRHDGGVSNDYSKISEYIDRAVKRGNLGVYTPAMSFYSQDGKEIESLSKQYEKEIKLDTELFAQTGQRISRIRINAYKDFAINKYAKEQEEAIKSGGDGKNYLGKEFNAMVDAWVQESGMVKAKPVLDDGIAAIKTVAFNEKFWTQKAKVENARDIMHDGIEKLILLSQEKSWLENTESSADLLKNKIHAIVNLSENGDKWLEKVGEKHADEKLAKAVEKIIESAVSKEGFTNSLKRAAMMIFA